MKMQMHEHSSSIMTHACMCWYRLDCVALKSQPKTKKNISCMVVHEEKNDEGKGWVYYFLSIHIFHCSVVCYTFSSYVEVSVHESAHCIADIDMQYFRVGHN